MRQYPSCLCALCSAKLAALCSAGLKVSCARRTTGIAGGNVLPSKFGALPIQGPSRSRTHSDCILPHLWVLAHLVSRSVPACQSDVPPSRTNPDLMSRVVANNNTRQRMLKCKMAASSAAKWSGLLVVAGWREAPTVSRRPPVECVEGSYQPGLQHEDLS